MEMNVQLIHVTKKFKTFTALSDVNAYFEAGKIHGIIGRNGSCKWPNSAASRVVIPGQTGP